jgi:hypothetical protein
VFGLGAIDFEEMFREASKPLCPVVYPNSAVNSIAPKTGQNALISTDAGGGNAMVSQHFVDQLVLFALIWLFIMLHLIRPKPGVSALATSVEPEPLKPKRHRSSEP